MNKSFKHLYTIFSILAVIFLFSCKNDEEESSLSPFEPPTLNSKIEKRFAHYYKGEISDSESSLNVKTYIALTAKQQEIGLSYVLNDQMNDTQALLFLGTFDTQRQFWMPDTHFNLDIFFLSKDFIVIDIHRNVQHFPARNPDHKIPRAKSVYCRHVLEMRADSKISSKIKYGMKLNFNGKKSIQEILEKK
jgi:uncharacterized membrane protein (UPF0127 family)